MSKQPKKSLQDVLDEAKAKIKPCSYKIRMGAAYTVCASTTHQTQHHTADDNYAWGLGLAFAIKLIRADMQRDLPGDRLAEIQKALLGVHRLGSPSAERVLDDDLS